MILLILFKLDTIIMKYLPTAQLDIRSNMALLEIHFSVLVFRHRNRLVSVRAAG